METRGLSIETPEIGQLLRNDMGKLGSYCGIMVPQGTKSIPIVVTSLDPHRRFASFGTEGRSSAEQNSATVEVTAERPFHFPPVPVRWKDRVPQTREEPRDNFRIPQVNRNGGMSQMEVGITTRGERIFLTAQLQFRGIIVPNGSGSTLTVAPALEHFSYPGFAGYNKSWPGILPHIQKWTAKWGVKPEGRSPKVRWNPGHNPFGQEGAAVLFFSPVGGTGRLLTAKGVEHFLLHGELLPEEVLFLHFTGLDPEVNDQLGVEPMTWVKVGEVKPPRAGTQLHQATHVTLW